MLLHIDSDASYLCRPRAGIGIGGNYYLSSQAGDPKQSPHLSSPGNVSILTEYRILRQVVAYNYKVEVGGLFRNGKISVPLKITINYLGFTQQPTPIKTDNSTAEGNVAATVRQISTKSMDMIFYWMKEWIKKDFFIYW